MLSPERAFTILKEQGITFFTGVPDSLLSDFCAYVTDHMDEQTHVIAANEGNAIALAAGWFIAGGEPALVYMQNSGIGNAINPLLSLADPEIYSIPMLIMVGWRGEPGKNDEPQHIKQGRILLDMLEKMELPYFVLDEKTKDPEFVLTRACLMMMERRMPVFLVVSSDVFSSYTLQKKIKINYWMSREEAMKLVINLLNSRDIVISTTGKLSRELYEYREQRGEGHGNDFLTVGSMGHTSSIAMGVAAHRPDRRVFCFDGDGSAIMHMGAFAIIGQSGLKNFIHVVFNNGSHDSVGGQPTVGFSVDIPQIAKACGYREAISVSKPADIEKVMDRFQEADGPALLEIRINKGARSDLGRPKSTPLENRNAFMTNLGITKQENSDA